MQVHIIAIGFAVCALSVFHGPLAQRIVRWDDTSPGSGTKSTSTDGTIAKHLVVDQIAISASLVDRGHSFEAVLEFTNASLTTVDLRPELVELHRVRPRPAPLQLVAASTLADKVRSTGNGRAGAIELQGFAATTTRPETVPVVEVAPNPAALTDPTQPPTIVTMGTSTVINTVPDDAERMRTLGEGAVIRQQADAAARRIVQSALRGGRVAPTSRAAGSVYYQRDGATREVLLRIPLGQVTVEIPFAGSKRWRLIGPRPVIFQ